MEESTVNVNGLAAISRRLVRRLVVSGENRLELLVVEVQEERERLLHAFLLAVGVAVFGLLASLTMTASIVVLLWAWSHAVVLLILTVLYGGAGICLYRRLTELRRNWQTFSTSLDQLRKDRECLEKVIG